MCRPNRKQQRLSDPRGLEILELLLQVTSWLKGNVKQKVDRINFLLINVLHWVVKLECFEKKHFLDLKMTEDSSI